jgi:hypothetical protein
MVVPSRFELEHSDYSRGHNSFRVFSFERYPLSKSETLTKLCYGTAIEKLSMNVTKSQALFFPWEGFTDNANELGTPTNY